MMWTTPLLFALAAGPGPQAQAGRALFHDPGLGKNGIACAGCHATVRDEGKEGDGLIRSGHSLHGVSARPYWRGDQARKLYRKLSQAVDVCSTLFQGGPALTGRKRLQLRAFLISLSPRAKAPPVKIEPALEADLDYSRSKYASGRVPRGRDLFYRACHGCHPHGGPGIAPDIRGLSEADVVKKVREGNGLLRGKQTPGEWSPFFGKDRLTDQQVADIAAWVATRPKAQ